MRFPNLNRLWEGRGILFPPAALFTSLNRVLTQLNFAAARLTSGFYNS